MTLNDPARLGFVVTFTCVRTTATRWLLVRNCLLFLISIAGFEEVLDYHIAWCFNSHLCGNWLRPLLCLFRAFCPWSVPFAVFTCLPVCDWTLVLGNIAFDLVFPIKLLNLITVWVWIRFGADLDTSDPNLDFSQGGRHVSDIMAISFPDFVVNNQNKTFYTHLTNGA